MSPRQTSYYGCSEFPNFSEEDSDVSITLFTVSEHKILIRRTLSASKLKTTKNWGISSLFPFSSLQTTEIFFRSPTLVYLAIAYTVGRLNSALCNSSFQLVGFVLCTIR